LLQHRSRTRRTIIVALVALFVMSEVRAAGEQIPRSAVTGGGGTEATTAVRLRASIGQPVAGTSSSILRLCGGIICGTGVPDTPDPVPPVISEVFLPLLVR
jgi:hypothetical protein